MVTGDGCKGKLCIEKEKAVIGRSVLTEKALVEAPHPQ